RERAQAIDRTAKKGCGRSPQRECRERIMVSTAAKVGGKADPRERGSHTESAEPNTNPPVPALAGPASGTSATSVTIPTHDKDMAAQFLSCLDPNAHRF